jgi:hypothetical protein
MRAKIAIVAAIVIAGLSLAACDNSQESGPEYNIRIGKVCADAGGSWTWSDWSGYHCTIKGKP